MQPITKSLVLFLCGTIAAFAKTTPDFYESPQQYRAAVRHIESGGIGYNQGYTTLEAFIAPDPDEELFMPFLDTRGHIFNHGKLAANAGIGVRATFGNRAYGINGYYDYRNTTKLHYNQIGVGIETLGILWDFRMNGYLPVGTKLSSPYDIQFSTSSTPHTILSEKRQFAMKGLDAEIGFHFGKCSSWNFYAAAGPYYYDGPIGHNAWGGKARFSSSYKKYVTLEISDSYDTQFHNRFQGQLVFSFPFGANIRKKESKNSLRMDEPDVLFDCRMLQPVGRNEIIVVKRKKQHPD